MVGIGLVACGGGAIRDADPQRALADMNAISAPSQTVASEMLAYVQAVAHSRDRNAAERKRLDMIASVERAILSANQVKPYNGDQRYKDAVLDFYNTLYAILRRDYANLVNLQEIREQSYDNMEAYLTARQKANEKLQEAAERLRLEEKEFAADYNITLVETQSETARKLELAGAVMDYQSKVYLISFRSYLQENYLIEALNRKDVNALEQNRESLQASAEAALGQLQAVPPYSGDASLLQAAAANLEFYREEAAKHTPLFTEQLLRSEQFEEMKQAFDRTPPAQRSREAVDNYNRAVSQLNSLSARTNQLNQQLNQRRTQLINQWNAANEAFLRRHVPR